MPAWRVLHACSEVYPLLKTGGLADVTGALPPALARVGCDVRMLLPGFDATLEGLIGAEVMVDLGPRFQARSVRLLRGRLPNGLIAYVIDAPDFYRRAGHAPYAADDNHLRFALLGWVAADLAVGLDPQWQAQLIHAHDWHAGLAPAYARAWERANGRRAAACVFTIHNLAYQGNFPAASFAALGLPPDFYAPQGLEYYGQASFLKAGLHYADHLTTVSPTYAREIQQPEQGCGMEGVLRERAAQLTGILNGVDYAIWHPARDASIAQRYDVATLQGKLACRRALQLACGLATQTEAPLLGVVSRLTEQKGLHLLLNALPELLREGVQLALLGSGDAQLEQAFRSVAAARPDAVSVQIGYDEEQSHRIIAGVDVLTVPSRFEPCGLTQLYALAYGTLPLVRRVGGLADSVVDLSEASLKDGTGTGFVFDDFNEPALIDAARRALALHRRPDDWRQAQTNAMHARFGWDEAAAQLLPIYRNLMQGEAT